MTNKVMLECLECYAKMYEARDKGIRALEQDKAFEIDLLKKRKASGLVNSTPAPSDIINAKVITKCKICGHLVDNHYKRPSGSIWTYRDDKGKIQCSCIECEQWNELYGRERVSFRKKE